MRASADVPAVDTASRQWRSSKATSELCCWRHGPAGGGGGGGGSKPTCRGAPSTGAHQTLPGRAASLRTRNASASSTAAAGWRRFGPVCPGQALPSRWLGELLCQHGWQGALTDQQMAEATAAGAWEAPRERLGRTQRLGVGRVVQDPEAGKVQVCALPVVGPQMDRGVVYAWGCVVGREVLASGA